MKIKLNSTVIACALVATTFAVDAKSLPPLEENSRVRGEFLAAAIGDEIRKNCPSISARMLRVLGRVNKLEEYAISQGYTKSDIKEMREDPGAKARLKAMRDDYLAANGVVAGNPDSYCRLGHEEIQKKSLTGWLLRAK